MLKGWNKLDLTRLCRARFRRGLILCAFAVFTFFARVMSFRSTSMFFTMRAALFAAMSAGYRRCESECTGGKDGDNSAGQF